jgi:hypothetical protein
VTSAPLWQQIFEADAIVLATVVSVETSPSADAAVAGGPPIVRLRVMEAWKGEIAPEVSMPMGGVARGDTVPIFLARDDEIDSWSVSYAAYPIMNASPADTDVYAARVREALDIQQRMPDRITRIEWLVRCAENRVTRWDGLVLLQDEAADDDRICIPPAEQLTDDHRHRIAMGFIRDPQIDATIPLLVDVLGAYRDARFDRELIAAIDRAFDSEARNAWTCLAMAAMLSRWGDKDAESRFADVLARPTESYWTELRKEWTRAKARMIE